MHFAKSTKATQLFRTYKLDQANTKEKEPMLPSQTIGS